MESSVIASKPKRRRRHRNKQRSWPLSKSSSALSNNVHVTTSCQSKSNQPAKSIEPAYKKLKSGDTNNTVKNGNDIETINFSQIKHPNGQQSIKQKMSLNDLLKNFKATADEIQKRCQAELKDDPTKTSEIADALQVLNEIQQATKLHAITTQDIANPLTTTESVIVAVSEIDHHSQNNTEVDSLLKSVDTADEIQQRCQAELKDDPTKASKIVDALQVLNDVQQATKLHTISTQNKANPLATTESVIVAVSEIDHHSQNNTEVDSLLKSVDNIIIEDNLEKVNSNEANNNGKPEIPMSVHNDVTTSVSSIKNIETSVLLDNQHQSFNKEKLENKTEGVAELSNEKMEQKPPQILKINDEAESNHAENMHRTENLTNLEANNTGAVQPTEFPEIIEESKVSRETQLEDREDLSIPINPNKGKNKLMKKGAEKVNSIQTKNVCKCQSSINSHNDATSGAKIHVDATNSRIAHEIQMQELMGMMIEDSEESVKILNNVPQIAAIAKVFEKIVNFQSQNGLIFLQSNSVQANEQEATEQEDDCIFCNPQPGPSHKKDFIGPVCKRNHGSAATIAKANDNEATVATIAKTNDNEVTVATIAKTNDNEATVATTAEYTENHSTVTTVANHNCTERTEEGSDLLQKLMELEEQELIPNIEAFTCEVCLNDCEPGEGVMLHRCLHTYCRECLANLITTCEEARVKCPYRSEADMTACNEEVLDSEIRMLISEQDYEKRLALGLRLAETAMQDAFHCQTPGCPGWCVRVPDSTEFQCPCCCKVNCLRCMVIHPNETCSQYLDRIDCQVEFGTSKDENKNKETISRMLNAGEAMRCSKCNIVVMKEKDTCDWIQCTNCHTELCWATKGPRWGRKGKGDTSGGCRCKVGGIPCHPKCGFCH